MKITKEEKIRRIMGATDWLVNVYGLDENGCLSAGEIEELLDLYINGEGQKLIHQAEQRGREEALEIVEKRRLQWERLMNLNTYDLISSNIEEALANLVKELNKLKHHEKK